MSGQPHHQNEGLSHSVSSTPSSSVQPLELPAQELLANQMQQDNSIHVQGTSMVAPGDVSMDGSEDQNPQASSLSKVVDPSLSGKDNSSKSDSKAKDKRERLSRACVACHTGKTRCSNTLPCESCVKRGIGNTCAYPDPLDPDSAANHPIAPRRRGANANSNAQAQTHVHGSPAGSIVQTPGGIPMGAGPSPGPNNQPQAAGQTVFSAGPTVRGFYYDNGSGSGQGTLPVPSFPSSNGSLVGPGTPGAVSLSVGMRREQTPPQSGGRPAKKARYRNLTDIEIASFQQPKGSTFKRGTFYVGESAPVSIDPRLPLRLLLADDERVDFIVGEGALPP